MWGGSSILNNNTIPDGWVKPASVIVNTTGSFVAGFSNCAFKWGIDGVGRELFARPTVAVNFEKFANGGLGQAAGDFITTSSKAIFPKEYHKEWWLAYPLELGTNFANGFITYNSSVSQGNWKAIYTMGYPVIGKVAKKLTMVR
ncbi:hypothetical protein FACS1894152_7890 [Bacilli bacterium]|nr:hypothetical protein FACS1894152_7890 [Bacilli bacterium]